MTDYQDKPKINIGIDFGAASIVVACFNENDPRPVILLDAQENRMTPTCLAFINNQRLLAFAADSQATSFPEAIIFGRDIKLVLGEKKIPEYDPSFFPLQITQNQDLGIVFELEYNATTIQILPEQVIAELLIFLKENIVQQYPDCEIGNCVITAPFVYNEAKKSAMVNACVAAGFDEKHVDMISSSMAATITYYMEQYKSIEPKRVLVFDMGATSIDYTLVSIKDSELKVEISGGELDLGGFHFTMRLVDHFLSEFNESIKQDKQAMIRLIKECDTLKKKLFLCDEAKSVLGSFHDAKDHKLHITKGAFEKICSELIDKIFNMLEEKMVKVPKIDEFIVIGGGARITLVQERLKKFFMDSQFLKVLNQDDAAALGAAFYATKLGLKIANTQSKLNSLKILGKNCTENKFKTDQTKVNYMKNQIEKVKLIETDFQEKRKALNDLQSYCFKLKKETKKSNLRNEAKIEITAECERILTWVDNYKGASKEDFLQKYEDLKSFNENRNQSENKPQSNENQPSSNESLYPKQNRDLTKRNTKKNKDDSDFEKQKMTNIENLIKNSDYNGALNELDRIIRRLNEDLDDENFILFSYTKRAEVYQLMELNGKALLDYNHLLDSNRFSAERKEIEIKRDVIENDLVKHEILSTIERCKKIAQIGSHKASEIDREIENLLAKINFEKYKQQKGEIYYEHAKIHFKFKNYPKTIDLANMALQNRSNKDDLYDIIGQSYFNLDDFEQAKTNFETVHDMNPTKDSREKIDKCKLGIRLNEIKTKLKAVETLLKQQKYEKSLNMLKNINLDHVTCDYVMFDILYKKCLTLFGCKEYEEALIQCNKTLIQVKKMRPEDRSQFDVKVQEMQDKRNVIDMEIIKKDITETIGRCKKLAELGIHQTSEIDREIESLLSKVNVEKFKHFKGDIYYEHAKIHFYFRNYQNTIDLANNALQNNLKNTDLYDMIGQSYYNLNNFEQARVNFELAYKLNNSQELKDKIEKCKIAITRNLLSECEVLYQQQKYVDSLKKLETIILRNIPDNELIFDISYLKFLSLLGCNKHEDALKQCNEALKLNSSQFTKVQEIKIKRDEIKKELVNNKITKIIEKCIQLSQYGSRKAFQIDDEINKLIKSLSKAELNIYKGYIYLKYANICISFQNYEKAIKLAEKGMRNHEGDKILLDLIGNCYFNLGKFEKAKENFEAANQLCYSEILRDKIEKCNKESRTAEIKRNLKYCKELCQEQKYDESLKILECIDLNHITHEQLQFEFLFRKAITLFGCKMYEDAASQSNEALQLIEKLTKIGVPNNKYEIRKKKSRLNIIKGESYFYQNYFEKAKTVFKEAQMVENTKNIAEYVEKCNQQLFLGEVIQQLEVSNNFYIKKKFEDALNTLKHFDTYKITDFNLKIKIFYERARCNYSLEKFPLALEQCETVIKMWNLNHNKNDHAFKSEEATRMKLIYQELHSIAGNICRIQEKYEQGNFYLEIAQIYDDQPFLKAIKNRLESSEELFKKSKFCDALNLLQIIDKEQIYDDHLKHKVIIALAQVYLKLKYKNQAISLCNMLPPGIFEDKVKQVREEAKSRGFISGGIQYVKQLLGFFGYTE